MCDWVGADCLNHGLEGWNLKYRNVLSQREEDKIRSADFKIGGKKK